MGQSWKAAACGPLIRQSHEYLTSSGDNPIQESTIALWPEGEEIQYNNHGGHPGTDIVQKNFKHALQLEQPEK